MNKSELGQVFTNRLIADYMVTLFDLANDSAVLDPCFGGGAFIDALQRAGFSNIAGCELDNYLYNLAEQRFQNVSLNQGDFLKFQPETFYDGIIMNPPYIRQEKIDGLSCFGITKDNLALNPLFKALPRVANLYMYFVLKALVLLKDKGQMVIIFPSSWLEARGGKTFKDHLYTECDVVKQIHIHGEVFEGAALVDVVILKIIKQHSTNSTEVVSLIAENGKIKPTESDTNVVNISFSVPFTKYACVRRGLTTGYNEAFINPLTDYDLSDNLCPILSSPKDIYGYSTRNARYDSLLSISSATELSDDVKSYLKGVQGKIVDSQKPKTLYKKIRQGEAWYKLNTFSGQGILFSYFVRSEMKFVMHQEASVVRDNFYVITPLIDIWLMMALLNNYYTFYQLEKSGKKYGAGLLKLQRYDIENLVFPDVALFSEQEIIELTKCARNLAATGEDKYISDITTIISKFSTVSDSEITRLWVTTKTHRLENY